MELRSFRTLHIVRAGMGFTLACRHQARKKKQVHLSICTVDTILFYIIVFVSSRGGFPCFPLTSELSLPQVPLKRAAAKQRVLSAPLLIV
jgi:hypothetical protein